MACEVWLVRPYQLRDYLALLIEHVDELLLPSSESQRLLQEARRAVSDHIGLKMRSVPYELP